MYWLFDCSSVSLTSVQSCSPYLSLDVHKLSTTLRSWFLDMWFEILFIMNKIGGPPWQFFLKAFTSHSDYGNNTSGRGRSFDRITFFWNWQIDFRKNVSRKKIFVHLWRLFFVRLSFEITYFFEETLIRKNVKKWEIFERTAIKRKKMNFKRTLFDQSTSSPPPLDFHPVCIYDFNLVLCHFYFRVLSTVIPLKSYTKTDTHLPMLSVTGIS